MSKKKKKTNPLLLLFSVVLLVLYSPPSSAVDFLFNGFNPSDVALYANATLDSSAASSGHRYLSLTATASFSLGRALYPSPIPTKLNNSSSVLAFYASFIFSVAPVAGVLPGHGFAFLFAPAPGTNSATSSQHLGLFNLSTDGDPSSRVLAIEFDVFQNEEFNDINANHVGVDRNSLTSVDAAAAGYWTEQGSFVNQTLNDGSNYQAWVDYAVGLLNVTMAPVSLGRKPSRPLISIEIELSDLFLDKMYVGFCAATGMLVERHLVLAWSFSNSNFSASEGLITSDLPNFMPPATKSAGGSRKLMVAVLSAGAAVLLISAVAVAALFVVIRQRKRIGEEEARKRSDEVMEEWELEYWPHRIGYHELVTATDGFSDRNLIARGGDGRVYKGVLGGVEVAVKLFSQTNDDEAKNFVAEVSSLGRLKHRNLVGLRGWCKTRREGSAGCCDVMLLVYEYMENGSLDKWVFSRSQPLLDWKSRVRILRDVAAALLYLHEGWGEAVVLHRDIKASNVLLDGAMAGRLGDFGLARVHRHGRPLGTTRVVGSAGYLAPEVVRSGRATAATDVYAYGVVVLEVVSGRPAAEDGHPPMVAWARAVKEAVVENRVRGDEGFNEREAEWVVAVGLACTCDDSEERPTMREVVRMLEMEELKEGSEGESAEASLLDSKLKTWGLGKGRQFSISRWQQRRLHHLTFEEVRQSMACSTSISGSDFIVESR